MPVSAMILAVMNVLAAGAFIYLAGLDYGARQAWALAAFQHQLALDGLPLDDADPGHRVTEPLFHDLGGDEKDPPLLVAMFKNAGKPVVKTQQEEVKRLQDALIKEFISLDKDARQKRIRDLLLAVASTYAERREIMKQARDPEVDLEKQLMAKFEHAQTDRRAAAHLLYNLDPSLESHQRLMVIIGLKAYVTEAEEQSRALREMVDGTRYASIDDRLLFEASHQRNRDRILELVLQVDRQTSDHEAHQRLVKRIDEELIKPQGARIEELKADKDKLGAAKTDRLKQQSDLEEEVFKLHRQMSNLLDENLRLERTIREIELGRTRGGRR